MVLVEEVDVSSRVTVVETIQKGGKHLHLFTAGNIQDNQRYSWPLSHLVRR